MLKLMRGLGLRLGLQYAVFEGHLQACRDPS